MAPVALLEVFADVRVGVAVPVAAQLVGFVDQALEVRQRQLEFSRARAQALPGMTGVLDQHAGDIGRLVEALFVGLPTQLIQQVGRGHFRRQPDFAVGIQELHLADFLEVHAHRVIGQDAGAIVERLIEFFLVLVVAHFDVPAVQVQAVQIFEVGLVVIAKIEVRIVQIGIVLDRIIHVLRGTAAGGFARTPGGFGFVVLWLEFSYAFIGLRHYLPRCIAIRANRALAWSSRRRRLHADGLTCRHYLGQDFHECIL